jgi:type I restriction enzyme S subunit
VADGTTFTNRVRPGQVLFGKRRAYQRKVAVADFDAVCSGDIYVLESADHERLLPELLPFLCQTDSFFDHAVGTSAGSLSPRTSWKGLAEYALAIPPIEEQRRLSIPLLTANATAISLKVAAARGEEAFHASLHKYMGAEIVNGTIAKQEEITVEGTAELVTLSEISLVERGMFSHRPRNLPEFFGGPYPFVQTGDVAASRGSLGPAPF